MSEVMLNYDERARFCVDEIIDDADVGGIAHAPCFRDCLSDNRKTAEARIARAIRMAVAAALGSQSESSAPHSLNNRT